MAKVHVRVRGQVDGVYLLSAKEYEQRVREEAHAACRKTARDFGKAVQRAMERAKSRSRK